MRKSEAIASTRQRSCANGTKKELHFELGLLDKQKIINRTEEKSERIGEGTAVEQGLAFPQAPKTTPQSMSIGALPIMMYRSKIA